MHLYEICFSPTGGTKRVADCLADALADQVTVVDLTDAETDFHKTVLRQQDIAVVAVPSYGGRVPAAAADRITALQGGGARALLVCVYGNRAYEDTLIELQDLAEQAGFRVIAGITAVAEHSILRQYAAGRPDAADRLQLTAFAEKLQQKIETGGINRPDFPGNRPYKKAGRTGLVPRAGKRCTRCGACAKACPVGAIDTGNPTKVDGSRCISCMRCISVCPQDARQLNPILLFAAGIALRKACAERKNCALYL